MAAEKPFDVFISYSHADAETGWVTGLRDALAADFEGYGRPLRIFLDTSDLHSMDDWEHRILGALEDSRVLLICQSPNYYASTFCRREWEEYLRRHRATHESVAVVYFVEVPDSDATANADWRSAVSRAQHVDLRSFFDRGVDSLLLDDVRARLADLGTQVWQRVDRALRAEAVPGNVPRQNPYFVGRQELIRDLHERVGTRGTGRVAVVQGLGGLGKTELVIQYAHAYRDQYDGGVWQVDAEGATALLPCLARLAAAPELGLALDPADRDDPATAGRRVLAALHDRCGEHGRTLVVLDNLSEPALLSAREAAALPDEPWLRLVATTREDAGRFPPAHTAVLTVGPLSFDESIELLREHQPARDAARLIHDFSSPEDAAAAREIAGLLDGFTLAVEQVAVHLGRHHADQSVADFAAGLRAEGVTATDALAVAEDVAEGIRHRDHLLSVVLGQTLAGLEPAARTALAFAAFLPPDEVPWPWLEELSVAAHPELGRRTLARPNPWSDVRRRLEGQRLVGTTTEPALGRVHRLVGAHLAATVADRDEVVGALRELCERRLAGLSDAVPPAWEPPAMAHTVLSLAPTPSLRRTAGNAQSVLARYVVDGSVEALAGEALGYFRQLADAQPGNLEAQRDLTVSLDNVAGLERYRDLDAALARYTESLTLRRQLADAQPGNLEAQRDLTVSLNNVAGLERYRDLDAALARYTESLTLTRQLADAQPGNLEAQRDLVSTLHALAAAEPDERAAIAHLTEAASLALDLARRQPTLPSAFGEATTALESLARRQEASGATAGATWSQLRAALDHLATLTHLTEEQQQLLAEARDKSTEPPG